MCVGAATCWPGDSSSRGGRPAGDDCRRAESPPAGSAGRWAGVAARHAMLTGSARLMWTARGEDRYRRAV